MYSRSYSGDNENMLIPDGYAGTALPLGVHSEPIEDETEKTEPVSIDKESEKTEPATDSVFIMVRNYLTLISKAVVCGGML